MRGASAPLQRMRVPPSCSLYHCRCTQDILLQGAAAVAPHSRIPASPLPDSTGFLPSQTPPTQDSPLSHKPCGAPRRLTIHHHSSCCSDITHTTQPRCGISRTQKLVKTTESSERAGACVGVESARREVTEHQTASSTAPSAPLEKISF